MATDNAGLTPLQQKMVEVWEQHLEWEFAKRDPVETLKTMAEQDAYVYNVGSGVGGASASGVLEGMNYIDTLNNFYSKTFIPQLPADIEVVRLSRTVGETQIVDEMVLKFTHTVKMDWLLPGFTPTNKRIEMAVVGIIKFDGEKVKAEHIYWDQASVLVQAGLLERVNLPVAGAEAVHQLLKFYNTYSPSSN